MFDMLNVKVRQNEPLRLFKEKLWELCINKRMRTLRKIDKVIKEFIEKN